MINSVGTRRSILRSKVFVLNYLLIHPCIDCRESDPRVLDFDHRGDKKAEIAQLVKSGRLSVIQTEILKCDVRCANCHRKRHTTSDSYRCKTVAQLQAEHDGLTHRF